MKLKWVVLLMTAGLVAAQAATAGTVVLTFSQLGILSTSGEEAEPILNFYDGGYAGNGTANCGFAVCGPGPDYSITFESNALVDTSKLQGGDGNFDGEPTCCNGVFFLEGSGDTMNVAGGFTTGFSFYYSSPQHTGSVTVWSGPDATGTELANILLPTTPNGRTYGSPCNPSLVFCPLMPFGVTFTGTAESVDFSGTANHIGFQDITLGSSTPGTSTVPPTTTPEPASLILLGTGILGLATKLRRLGQSGRQSGTAL